MKPVTNIWDTMHERRNVRSCLPVRSGREKMVTGLSLTNRRPPDDREIDRAIMLLDAAAEQAQLVTLQANDPSCSGGVETQVATIVELLGLARDVTSRLE